MQVDSVSRAGRTAVRAGLSVVAAVCLLAACVPEAAPDATFQVKNVLAGFVLPTAVRFAPDGRVFVAERGGRILGYDSVDDPTGTIVANLSNRVTTMWDRSLAGLELDPGFSTGRPYLYALYSKDGRIGATPPEYPDDCLFAGSGNDGVCGVTSGELMRIEVGPDNRAVSQTVLINDWCQQFGGHSVGDLEFAPDGSLFVSAGDGASFETVDSGQLKGNPCGDPVGEGGMLRAQDVRTTGDPTTLDGTVIRIDPDTGNAWPTNPWASDPDPNRARIIAYGFRLPFRLTYDSATDKLYVGEVGWGLWEEVNVVNVSAAPANYGWPCFEGNSRQPGVDASHLAMCDSLKDTDVTPPAHAYSHSAPLDAACGTGGTSVTGVAIERNGAYPAPFNNGLFFADYSRQCIFYVPRLVNGNYNFGARSKFVSAARAVDLQVGPGGDLFYPDIVTGTVKRIVATGSNHPPEARLSVTPRYGPVPLDVTLDGSGSTDSDSGEAATRRFGFHRGVMVGRRSQLGLPA